ncbi:MAG TPA: hypothetical protein VEA38_15195 [Terriglobales bacterium]|nr:hypothetical protein [Terriglobales bacterium]
MAIYPYLAGHRVRVDERVFQPAEASDAAESAEHTAECGTTITGHAHNCSCDAASSPVEGA